VHQWGVQGPGQVQEPNRFFFSSHFSCCIYHFACKKGIAGYVFTANEPLIVNRAHLHNIADLLMDRRTKQKTTNVLAVPVVFADNKLGFFITQLIGFSTKNWREPQASSSCGTSRYGTTTTPSGIP